MPATVRSIFFFFSGRRVRVPARLFSGHVLPGVRRRRRKGVRVGLEDDEAVQQVQGTRECLHRMHLAPPRNVEAPYLRLGRSNQALGLKRIEILFVSITQVRNGFLSPGPTERLIGDISDHCSKLSDHVFRRMIVVP